MEIAIYPKNGQQIGMTSFKKKGVSRMSLQCINKGQVGKYWKMKKASFPVQRLDEIKCQLRDKKGSLIEIKNDY